MPNIKSAKKTMKTSAVAREANKALKSVISTTRRSLYEAIHGGDRPGSEALFSKYCSVLDKAVKKGAIRANAANRRKSRAHSRLASTSA